MSALDPKAPIAQQERADGNAIWSPLREAVYRSIWLATLISLTGNWMHDVGSAWLMRELSNNDPLLIGLVQSASFLPVMLLVLPAGTLADIVDRRRFLIVSHLWIAFVVALMMFLALRELLSPAALILLTIAIGIGKAMTLPAMASIIPELVARRDLHFAVGLNSVANNVARIIGPAIGGIVLALSGVALVYGLNLIGMLFAIIVLIAWKRAPLAPRRTKELFVQGIRNGVMRTVSIPNVRTVFVKLAVFFLAAGSVNALLPVISNDSREFGFLYGCYGFGALVGALLFSSLHNYLGREAHIGLGIGLHAVCLALVALSPAPIISAIALVGLGAGWFQVVSSAQLVIQIVLPEDLRARGMAVFIMMVMGGFALGAPLWGWTARQLDANAALLIAAGISIVALALTHALRLEKTPAGTDEVEAESLHLD